MLNKKYKIVVVCGPTATGKTHTALKLAEKLNCLVSIISIDSRQVYKDLPITTGQDIPVEFLPRKVNVSFEYNSIRLFGLNFLKANQQINLSDFTKLIWQIIEKETAQKRQIILAGGSGLYLQAITRPSNLIHIPPNLKLRDKLNKKTVLELQKILKIKNLLKFNSLNSSDKFNPRRLMRAIEIAVAGKHRQPDYFLKQGQVSFLWLGLQTSLANLQKRIKKRVQQRVEGGAIGEVQSLIKDYPDKTLPIYTTLGIAQILSYLNTSEKDDLVNNWTQAEFSYAKRQITWFKKQKQIICYDISNKDKLIKYALAWQTKN